MNVIPLVLTVAVTISTIMFINLIRNAAEGNEQSAIEFHQRIYRLVEENKADASRIPWVAKLAEWQ